MGDGLVRAVLRHRTLAFYLLAFAISWPAWLVMGQIVSSSDGVPRLSTRALPVYALSTIGGLGPLLALLVLEKLSRQEVRVKEILGQIRFRGARLVPLLAAAVLYPLCTVLGNLGLARVRGLPLAVIQPGPADLGLAVWPVLAIHFCASMITSPLFEEPGWRGFALPGLQSRWGREAGSLAVGLLWWLWHQPMNMAFGETPNLYSLGSMLALSFLTDSLYNLSDRNLLAAMFTHQSAGTTRTFLYDIPGNPVTLALRLAAAVALRALEARQSRR